MAITSSVAVKLLYLAVIAAAVTAPAAEALACEEVTSSVEPCVDYLKTGESVPPECCDGINSLKSVIKNLDDGQIAYDCIILAWSKIKGIELELLPELFGHCGLIPSKSSRYKSVQ